MRTAFTFLLSLSLSLSPWGGSAFAQESDRYSRDEVIVQFKPDVCLLAAQHVAGRNPLETVPFSDLDFRGDLVTRGGAALYPIGRRWRSLPRPHEITEYSGVVPQMPVSFRDHYLLEVYSGRESEELYSFLSGHPFVESVGRNWVLGPESYVPVDTLLACPGSCGRPYQWNLRNTGDSVDGVTCSEGFDIGAYDAWAIQESVSVKVGVFDSGIDTTHTDLASNIDFSLSRSFVNHLVPPTLDFVDDHGHGTRVAGVIGAVHSSDSLGVAGIAGLPASSLTDGVLVALKTYDDDTDEFEHLDNYVSGLEYVEDEWPSIPIVNSSLRIAISNSSPEAPNPGEGEVARDALRNAYLAGIFHSCSGGNPSNNTDIKYSYPRHQRHMVVGVSAVGCDSTRYGGLTGNHIDLCAPGTTSGAVDQIVTTQNGGGFTGLGSNDLFGQTSAAAPHVAGSAALLLSHSPTLTNEDLRELLQRTARDSGPAGYDVEFGHGLVRPDQALALLDSLVVVHSSTTAIDTSWVETAGASIGFRNIGYTTGLAGGSIGNTSQELYADIYEFRTEVALSENQETAHEPPVWIRGIGSACAPKATDDLYDGHFEAYRGDVVESDDQTATLRGYTYKIYEDIAAPLDSLLGWFPLRIPKIGSETVFEFTYLAHEGSGGNRTAPTTPQAPTAVMIRGLGPVTIVPDTRDATVLRIYDSSGRRVDERELFEDGTVRSTTWDATDRSGRMLPSGVYFGHVIGQNGQQTNETIRVIVVR